MDLIEQLHDIEGLDAISWWPLAVGWWAVLIVMLTILLGMGFWIAYRIAFKRSWKSDTLQKLAILEKNLSEVTARETLIQLSEYLRRIALKRFSRQECAGLSQEEWLMWLSSHDPQQFDWETKGRLLIEVPYSPLNNLPPIQQIKDLIQVVKQWVR